MKKTMLVLMAMMLAGCGAFKPKKTEFIKDGKVVRSVNGLGVFEGDDNLGYYKVWALNGRDYYEVNCRKCDIIETEVK